AAADARRPGSAERGRQSDDHRGLKVAARPQLTEQLAAELLFQIRLDRRSAKVRVDVGIAFLAQGLPDVVDVLRASRQLECAFDDVLGLHERPESFVPVMNGSNGGPFPAPCGRKPPQLPA